MAESGLSLPKPQPIIIPSFGATYTKIEPNYWLLNNLEIPLSPALPVPVSYQWQITSLYLPLAAIYQAGFSNKAHFAAVSSTIQAQLLRDGQVVWVAQTSRELPNIERPNENEAVFAGKLLLAEDFTNPIVISPGSRLTLQINGSAYANYVGEEEIKLKILNFWGGPQEGTPKPGLGGWPTSGILHYSLYTGS